MAKKTISEETKKVAYELQEGFKRRGYIVHRFNDYPNRTIYLKLDYGLLGSIRVSEKPESKDDYPYKYNVRIDLKKQRIVEKDGKVKYYYPYSSFYDIFEPVDFYYIEITGKYGKHWYNDKLKEYEQKYSCGYGYGANYFWRRAVMV